VERDGTENLFFAGCFGIFGHGNLAGIGQALQQTPDFRYYQSRNEQAQVHIAIGYAKMKNRLQTFACTSSIGPGGTNIITGAATLALPEDVQTEAFEYPQAFLEKRVWRIPRNRADQRAVQEAARLIRASKRPLIVAGGGVIYSEATETLRRFVDRTGIPVG